MVENRNRTVPHSGRKSLTLSPCHLVTVSPPLRPIPPHPPAPTPLALDPPELPPPPCRRLPRPLPGNYRQTPISYRQPRPRPTVIPNGINVPRFHDAAPIENPPWPKGSTVVGYIGRFDPVKRLDLLIHALEFLPTNFHLALVGWGTPQQEQYLRHLAAQLPQTPDQLSILNSQFSIGSRLHFLGPTTEPERWYKSFNIYCSLSASEGFGLTLAEAACAGIPIVTCVPPPPRNSRSCRLAPRQSHACGNRPPPDRLRCTGEIARNTLRDQNMALWERKITNQTRIITQNSRRIRKYLPNANAGEMLTFDQLEQRYGLGGMVRRYDACFRNLLD